MRNTLNLNHIKDYLSADVETFFSAGSNKDTRYLFKKTEGAKILAVAHLDTVQNPPKRRKIKCKKGILRSPCLDDRLGAYIVDEWLAKNGVVADVLLTDNEELGLSTAEFFDGADDYNWIVEFDRAGEDVVTYGIDSEEFIEALEGTGFSLGWGSFSDICKLKTERCAVNVGIGYEDAHGLKSYADLVILNKQLERFVEFYHRYKDVRFDADKKQAQFAGGWIDDPWTDDPWIDDPWLKSPQDDFCGTPCFGCNGQASDWFEFLGDVVPMCEYCAEVTNASWVAEIDAPCQREEVLF